MTLGSKQKDTGWFYNYMDKQYDTHYMYSHLFSFHGVNIHLYMYTVHRSEHNCWRFYLQKTTIQDPKLRCPTCIWDLQFQAISVTFLMSLIVWPAVNSHYCNMTTLNSVIKFTYTKCTSTYRWTVFLDNSSGLSLTRKKTRAHGSWPAVGWRKDGLHWRPRCHRGVR